MNDSFLSQFGDDEAQSVSEYTARLKQLLESRVAPSWVKGEVSNVRRQASGHIYFSLKDEGAQLPVVMFRSNASRLEFAIENGIEIVVYGEISLYEPHGRYQLIARAATPEGSGKLHREFERLKRKLLDEGLFDKGRKKPLPMAPRSIAFVTSPSGAAAQDFIRILKRREWEGSLTIIPALVQGRDASRSLIDGLRLAEALQRFDVVVIGRGGGSLEDLWGFNDETLARSIAASTLPVISAVGHEIDFTLTDFVADIRAETPSAAAELISSAYQDSVARVSAAADGLDYAWDESIERARRVWSDWAGRLRAVAPERAVERASLRMDEVASRMDAALERVLSQARRHFSQSKILFGNLRPERTVVALAQRLDNLEKRSRREVDHQLLEIRNQMGALRAKLGALSPDSTLKRGFSILAKANGKVIKSVNDISESEAILATLADGSTWLKKSDGE